LHTQICYYIFSEFIECFWVYGSPVIWDLRFKSSTQWTGHRLSFIYKPQVNHYLWAMEAKGNSVRKDTVTDQWDVRNKEKLKYLVEQYKIIKFLNIDYCLWLYSYFNIN
jgi:hypothetical protein